MNVKKKSIKQLPFDLTLVVTHNCNLSCVYCYEHNKTTAKRMSLEIAKETLSKYLTEGDYEEVHISFIGGEPLLEFALIRELCEWVWMNTWNKKYIFFATTNGTIMTREMKDWFVLNKRRFSLCLSLDGRKETHDINRCNSFDKIDLDFFLTNWPDQPIKMTISDKNLQHLADDVIFIQEYGFKIGGCNFVEGVLMEDFDTKFEIIAEQLKLLVDYYLNHPEFDDPRIFAYPLAACENRENESRKRCGTGDNMVVVDIDGKKYPCTFFSPVSMSEQQLEEILSLDFSDPNLFIDKRCFSECYIYPVCYGCYGDNYCTTGKITCRSEQKCMLNKLKIRASAQYHGQRLLKKLQSSDSILEKDALTINAILKINQLT
ncbi:MAG: 4Fe-4S cluster-binding domain-containing protein [Bacteroidales bacterium]|nr:4Fe-4S cluster-binding domain-containing protein [Bacteroidales bacterium]